MKFFRFRSLQHQKDKTNITFLFPSLERMFYLSSHLLFSFSQYFHSLPLSLENLNGGYTHHFLTSSVPFLHSVLFPHSSPHVFHTHSLFESSTLVDSFKFPSPMNLHIRKYPQGFDKWKQKHICVPMFSKTGTKGQTLLNSTSIGVLIFYQPHWQLSKFEMEVGRKRKWCSKGIFGDGGQQQ